MSYELEFEAEPFAGESTGAPATRCQCGACAQEAEFGIRDALGAAARTAKVVGHAAAGLLGGGSRIIDLTAKADKSVRKGTRDPRTVTALVLHQMACCANRKDPLNSYLKIVSHYTILRDGRILQMHPISSLLWASDGFNKRSVAVEFAGNLPDTKAKWWKGDTYGKNQLTRAQVEAGRYLIQHLVKTIGLKHVLAHRQSSGTRTNDPGPDIWFNVGQWAVDTLKLSDGGPGFKIDKGAAIPPEWRTWNKPLVGELDESATFETALAHDEWHELENEGEEEEDEFKPRGFARRSTRAPRGATTSSRPRPSRTPLRPRLPLRRRAVRFGSRQTQPCSCPQHGSENVRWFQSSLNRVLGLRLPVNGIIDAATRSGIRSFQEQRGLPTDGIAGPEVRRALIVAKGSTPSSDADNASSAPLEPASAAPSDSEMTEFDDGEWLGEVNRNGSEYTRWVQTSLNKLIGAKLSVDGIAGTYTRSAIRSFQSRVGLAADGIVGPLTESALMKAGAARPPGFQDSPPTSTPPPSSSPLKPSFITISSGVQMSPAIENAVRGLDEHFKRANLRVTLTSGVRSAEKQLSLIREQAIKRGIDKKHPSIRTATVDNISSWQGAWEELLHVHDYTVNPPKEVRSRVNGHLYSISPHMAGTAMDFSGADLDRIANVVKGYCAAGGVVSQILVERTNNAVHVGLSRAGSCSIQTT